MMTEEEWRTSTDGLAMAEAACNQPQSKRAIFNLICCQRVIDTVNFKPAHTAFEAYTASVWQGTTWDELYYHRTKMRDHIILRQRDKRQISFRKWAALQAMEICLWQGPCVNVARKVAIAKSWRNNLPCPNEVKMQADLAREVFGNIVRPVSFHKHWRTSDTLALATMIDETQAFGHMPILGDALMDAGCEDEEVIQHCRSSAPHVRGCWLVDMVLGRPEY